MQRIVARLAALTIVMASGLAITGNAVAAVSEIVYDNDFELDASGWYPFGDATVERTDARAHDGSWSLAATDRTEGFHGPALGLNSIVLPGATYQVDAWVLALADAAIGATLKTTTPGGDQYGGAASATVAADTWVQLTGTFTAAPDGTGFDLYFESATLTDLYVDDVVITMTQAPPADVEIVTSVDFEDGTLGDWSASGGATLTVVDDGGDQVLEIANRANDFDGIQSPTGIFEPGTEYTFSMEARLATPGSADIRFVMKPDYAWIGNTTITESWTTVTGTFTPADGTDPADLQVYLGTGEHDPDGATYTYLVDDIVITAPAGEPEPATVLATDFDDGTSQGWYGRGDATVTASMSASRSPEYGLEVAGRTATWQGPGIDVSAALVAGAEYAFSAWVQLPPGGETTGFNLAMVRTVDGTQNFEWISGFQAGIADDWIELSGNYLFEEADSLELYIEANTLTDFAVDDVVVVELSGPPPPSGVVLATDFEDGLDGWVPRDAGGDPTVSLSADAHESTQAALVSDRDTQGDGIGHDVTTIMPAGGNYEITAWVKMAAGSGPGNIWMSMRRTADGADTFDTIGQFPDVTADGWVQITATYRMPASDAAFLYFETDYPDGTADPFLLDDVVVTGLADPEIEDLTPIKDTVDFGMGVAVDSRETTGPAAELVNLHFDQLTPENHMKPEAWYDADRNFQVHPEAEAIMDFAQANGLGVYGHVLVWHSQTPAWFFERDDGNPLTNDPADQQFLRDRMRTHIFAIAEALADGWGAYGDGNPIVAWDVVNEVISDGATDDGMRRSRWYEILGEEYVDLAFQYADEAFNDVHAAAGSDRPVLLAINDYNTEQSAKRARMIALTQRLLTRGAPVDVFGHQFHVSLSLPVSALKDALADVQAQLGLTQVVTELDVTTGTPVTDALLIDQGYYYRDAFRVFRAFADDLYSVTVWGLTDNRSWRVDNGDPLVFDEDYQAKPAYSGIVDAALPAPQRTAFVFQPADGPTDLGLDAPAWDRLPLLPVGGDAGFQFRWQPDALTAYVAVTDATLDDEDAITFVVGDDTYTVGRDGAGDAPATVRETTDGYEAVVTLPLAGAVEGDTLDADVTVTDGATIEGWNIPGTLGVLTLIEPLSFTTTNEALTDPVVDGTVDPIWATAATISTETVVQGGSDGATAVVSTLWSGQTLYVLAEVTDATPDVSASDPWQQDSVEIFLDAGNAKNGPYRYDDTQIRINADNVVSFGTGDPDFQANRLTSATSATDTGYVVEAAISLLEYGGAGTFHGIDVQVNDGTDGARTSIRTWAEPTGTGYQTTARWGVTELVSATPDCDRTIEGTFRSGILAMGETVCIAPGAKVLGRVRIGDGGSLVARDADVRGNVTVRDGRFVEITGSDLRGGLKVTGVSDAVLVTDNSIRGAVTIVANPAPTIVVGGNHITGLLACWGNDVAIGDDGFPNVVFGVAWGSCSAERWWGPGRHDRPRWPVRR